MLTAVLPAEQRQIMKKPNGLKTTTAPVEPGNFGGISPEFGRTADVQRHFGIRRGSLYNLELDGKVKGVLLRIRGKKSGVRLWDLQSIRDYAQVFRSGAFEAVDADIFTQMDGSKIVASTYVEQHILEVTARYFKTAKQIGTPLPLVVIITAIGLKGYGMATNSAWINMRPTHTIDRNTLLLPDVLLEDYNTLADVLLKPLFDALWQSAGFPACQHYDKRGRWDGGKSHYA